MKLTPDDPRLTAYALGELTQTEHAAVEAHLKESPECRRAVEEIRETAQVLSRELAAESCPELSSAQRASVLASVRAYAVAGPHGLESSPARWFGWRLGLAVAGAAALVLGIVWVRLPRQTTPTQSSKVAVNSDVIGTEMAPLPLKLPMPAFIGTPTDIQIDEHMEKPSEDPRPAFLAPKDVENVALKKKITSSDKSPITGTLDLVTDGDKESRDDSFVELHRKTQWIQIDLEKPYEIYVIMVWHAHNTPQLYHDVVVQVSDDPDFLNNVTTVFNNDWENSSGLGVGKNREYFENYEGRLIDAKGVKGRYVRLYSKGSTYSALNRYTEVEVWALTPRTTAQVAPAETNNVRMVGRDRRARRGRDALPRVRDFIASVDSPNRSKVFTQAVASKTSPRMAPLPLKLPMPAFNGTPPDLTIDEHTEKPSEDPRPAFLAPQNLQNIALKKKVTSSDKSPITGTLDLVTDGDKESRDDSFVELHRKTQWIQIDLEKACKIYVIMVWHAHNISQLYHDVVVQVSDDPDFLNKVTTVFNNDWDNSSGLGVGKDKEYFENYEGRLIDVKGIKGRYVRLYSKGSTYSAMNRYTEVEVWGLLDASVAYAAFTR